MVRWPTSELPISPQESPTASPDARTVTVGNVVTSSSKTGVSAASTGFPSPGGATPHPSRMSRTTGFGRFSAINIASIYATGLSGPEQGEAGHVRRLGQAHEVQDGRRDVREHAVAELRLAEPVAD